MKFQNAVQVGDQVRGKSEHSREEVTGQIEDMGSVTVWVRVGEHLHPIQRKNLKRPA